MHCDQGFVKNNPKEGRKFMKVCQITRIQHIILHDSQTFYLTVDGRNLFEVYCSIRFTLRIKSVEVVPVFVVFLDAAPVLLQPLQLLPPLRTQTVPQQALQERVDLPGVQGEFLAEADQSVLLDLEVLDPLLHHLHEVPDGRGLFVVYSSQFVVLSGEKSTIRLNIPTFSWRKLVIFSTLTSILSSSKTRA
jgi:hypothetical protein